MSPDPKLPAGSSLHPPRPFFVVDESRRSSDGDSNQSTSPTPKAQSPTPSSSNLQESAPSTPHSVSFPAAVSNPFSPVASVNSLSVDQSPLGTPAASAQPPARYPFPDSGVTSRRTSTTDLPRTTSYYSSRPNTGEHRVQISSGVRVRESMSAGVPQNRPMTVYSTMNAARAPVKPGKRQRSTMLSETIPLEKPWLSSRDPYARVAYFLTYLMLFFGLGGAVVRCYFSYVQVPRLKGNLCLIMDEQFDGDDTATFGGNSKWFREVELGGFGNGEFEMTTTSSNNSFVQNGNLYIVPTLTSDLIGKDAIFNNTVYNLTDCTYNATQMFDIVSNPTSTNLFDPDLYAHTCGAVSNASIGSVINPVQSARLTTRYSASIRYGRVEVRAKIPSGDWIWPAIWMLPLNSTYGSWPLSGEIDIMESRGNSPLYAAQGRDVVRGSLNWGPVSFLNAVSKTFGWWSERRSSYNEAFHTYALEWDEDFIRIYVDTRLDHMIDLQFNKPFFERGDFPAVVQNGTNTVALQNPWVNGTNATPFDQPFYLLINVAVGGTNGWFPDNIGDKPWFDQSATAMRDFAQAQDTWYSTWPQDITERGMAIDYVKMWQQC